MSTLSIIVVCGFIYLMFVTWIFRKKGTEASSRESKPKPDNDKPEQGAENSEDSIIPKSDFDVETFRKVMTEAMTEAMTYILNVKTGEVPPSQVEFKNPEDRPSDDADKNEDPVTPDLSIDDVEPDTISPPATGDTIEDIEDALNVAANPGATAADKAHAGKVLTGMRDVVFIGKLMEADERINEGIMACIAESVRHTPKKRKGSPAPRKKNKPIDVGGTFRDLDMVKRNKDEED